MGRTKLTNLEKSMLQVIVWMMPVIERKVDAGECVHDIRDREFFKHVKMRCDTILAQVPPDDDDLQDA